MKVKRTYSFTALVYSCMLIAFRPAAADQADNIVLEVVSAPVVTNGIVAGEPAEINVFLNAPGAKDRLAFDAVHFGHQIAAGGRMEIEFAGTFQRNGVDNGGTFVPVVTNATFILTNGHPQNPIVAAAGTGMHQGNYTIEDDGHRIITIRPKGGSGPNGLENARATLIGFKVIHLRPTGNQTGPNRVAPFKNGSAGTEGAVEVRIFGPTGELVESGSGSVIFRAAVGRQVHITNEGLVDNKEAAESTNFQYVAPGTALTGMAKVVPFSAGAPYAPRFLLFEALVSQPDGFIPQKGIAGVGYIIDPMKPSWARLVEDTNDNGLADEDDRQIGKIKLKRKGRSEDPGRILPNASLTTSGDGVTGTNGSILNVPVQVGWQPGEYTVRISLDDGGQATKTIIVE